MIMGQIATDLRNLVELSSHDDLAFSAIVWIVLIKLCRYTINIYLILLMTVKETEKIYLGVFCHGRVETQIQLIKESTTPFLLHRALLLV